jgi:tetratricopeptide (TPR) repeat protein
VDFGAITWLAFGVPPVVAAAIWLVARGLIVYLESERQGKRALAEGRFDDAERCFQAAAEHARQTHFREAHLRAEALFHIALACFGQKKWADAERYTRQSMELLPSGNDFRRRRALAFLADICSEQARFREASAAAEESIRLAKQAGDRLGAGHGLSSLARSQAAQGKYRSSLRTAQEALELLELAAGTHDQAYTAVLGDIATTHMVLREHARAEEVLRRVVGLQEVREDSAANLSFYLHNLGIALLEQDKLTDAENEFRRALALRESAFGPDHVRLGLPLTNLGEVLRRSGRLREAEQALDRAVRLLKQHRDPELHSAVHSLARLRADQKRFADADASFRKSIKLFESRFGQDHVELADRLEEHAGVLAKLSRIPEAEEMKSRAASIRLAFQEEAV